MEVEKRLFQDALLRVQGAHMVRQREVLQDMVGSRTRSVLVLERNMARGMVGVRSSEPSSQPEPNHKKPRRMAWHHCLLTSTLTLTLPLTLTYYLPQAIRELLGKRGRAAWARRIFDAVYRAWKDIYVKGKAQRVAAGHQLHVRERVERSMREARQPHAQNPHPQHTTIILQRCNVALLQADPSLTIDPPLCPHPNPPNPHQERQQHGVQLAQLDAAMGELKHELTRAREAEAAEARRRERDDGLRIDALQKEVP